MILKLQDAGNLPPKLASCFRLCLPKVIWSGPADRYWDPGSLWQHFSKCGDSRARGWEQEQEGGGSGGEGLRPGQCPRANQR